mmetsp:Transcript_37198/g.43275  ORF Transcript_37198/g.43275 Transcript_37198/m.43275 type:complete len:443 (+) Transcript_37198:54-1382(+)|eukprot:CAMPEP_0194428898 /NCGR_PEP_ID=MMETSP0176-20130528/43564_1 /TAXON_ID=216777 /ORGANISM="Proboscia alata, Strain PI-D3" /LENGTH=442 /DNA_ID=CAMNT_0039241571 /DNA_START=24 /DNA_END=1352 /DNA_ORIENTATION=-
MPIITIDPAYDDDDNDSFFEVTAADQFIIKPNITSSSVQQSSLNFDDRNGVSGGGPPMFINAPTGNGSNGGSNDQDNFKRFSSITSLTNAMQQIHKDHYRGDARTTASMTESSSCARSQMDANRGNTGYSNSNNNQLHDFDEVSENSLAHREDIIASSDSNDEYIALRVKNRQYEEDIIRLKLELAETRSENDRNYNSARRMTQKNDSLHKQLESVRAERNNLLEMQVHDRVEIQEMEESMRHSDAATLSTEGSEVMKGSNRGRRFSTTQFGDPNSQLKLKDEDINASRDTSSALEIPFPERRVHGVEEDECDAKDTEASKMQCTSAPNIDTAEYQWKNQDSHHEYNAGSYDPDKNYERNEHANTKQEHEENILNQNRTNQPRARIASFFRFRPRAQRNPRDDGQDKFIHAHKQINENTQNVRISNAESNRAGSERDLVFGR